MMVTKEITLKRLRDEADYEEKLVEVLSDFLVSNLDNIPELNLKEKEKTEVSLDKLKFDSIKHKKLFEDLINHVLISNENQF